MRPNWRERRARKHNEKKEGAEMRMTKDEEEEEWKTMRIQTSFDMTGSKESENEQREGKTKEGRRMTEEEK